MEMVGGDDAYSYIHKWLCPYNYIFWIGITMEAMWR